MGFVTREERGDILYMAFNRLNQLGYKIQNPFRLQDKHIQALARAWEEEGLSASTLQKRFSVLRTYASWIGRNDLVPETAKLVVDPARAQRDYAADHDKSWSANEINTEEVAARLAARTPAAGLWVRLCKYFGLRRQEAIMIAPVATLDGHLVVSRGSKGGRVRYVPIRNEQQAALLNEVADFAVANGGSLIPQGMDLKQAVGYFARLLRSEGITKEIAGVTLHGLRAEYACDRLEDQGVKAPVRGGDLGDAPAEEIAVVRVMEELGHSRVNIGDAYYGKRRVCRNTRQH